MALLLKNALFTVVVPAAIAVYFPLLIARDERAPWFGSGGVAVALLALGGAVYLWCLWEFAAFGRGTPLPVDAPRKLVVRGPYQYTRNPMYLGVLTAIAGWALLFHSLVLVVYGVLVCIAFQSFIVFYEEQHLRRRFGNEYHEYCARVRRWLPIPRGRAA